MLCDAERVIDTEYVERGGEAVGEGEELHKQDATC